jgi:signal transduction histidine kinase
MRLADFILSNLEPILAGWEVFARSLIAGEHLNQLALRDHARQILQATARDMKSPQTTAERATKSKGLDHPSENDPLEGASKAHAVDRLGLGFDMLEVMSEYRALRASVLQLWRASAPEPDERDVDDLTRFNESIDQSLSKAVASYTTRVDQARDMFLAILSHDLRSPLNSIGMTAHMVPHVVNDPAKAHACSEQITRSVSVMERMISDLLDYTRTRLGTGMPVKPVPLDLAALARELIAEFRVAHPDREVDLRTEGDVTGAWDSDRVRQAISNLLGNALQHGSAECPVKLALRSDDADVCIAVHNGGDQIPPNELPNIFDPLIRGSSAEGANGNRHGSIGMGLYIAREVAEAHGGRIDVISTAENGTSFTIRLPRKAARESAAIPAAEPVEKM